MTTDDEQRPEWLQRCDEVNAVEGEEPPLFVWAVMISAVTLIILYYKAMGLVRRLRRED